jgi:rod shape-determining protein MreC
MTDYRSRFFLALLAAVLVAAALVNMVVDRRALGAGGSELSWWSGAVLDATVPVQKVISVPFETVEGVWQRYVALIGTEDENLDLRRELARLEDENLQLREALVAGGRLEQVAAMRDEFEIPMLPAELVGVDVSAWFRSVLLARGRLHGIYSGMPVTSEDGLVGLVTTTSRSASKVKLLLDRQSAVDGVVQRSRARGIVRGGHADEQLGFEYVVRGGDVEIGDEILTSGLGGVYPKGLRIGRVVDVSEPDRNLLAVATVEPAVDFARLEQVFVMLRRGATMELLYASGDGDLPEVTAAAP